MKHASRRPLAWLIFDVRPKNTVMRSFSMQSRRRDGDSIVFRWSGVRASIVGPFGLARLHRPGAPRWRSAERTRGPRFGSPSAKVAGCFRGRFSRQHFRPRFHVPRAARSALLEPSLPNKAPEPTTFAVTSRAIVRLSEMKQQNPHRYVARAAPAKVVAHL